jgi:hypothetical protein
MVGQAGLKAGAIGAGAFLLLALVNVVSAVITSITPTLMPEIPLELVPTITLTCVCCGTQLLAYAGVGMLAGYFLTAPRSAGTGAGAGAIAGASSGVGAGLGNTINLVIQTLTGMTATQAGRNDELIEQLIDIGLLDPSTISHTTTSPTIATAFTSGCMCCLASVALGAALGTLGGLIFVSIKQD